MALRKNENDASAVERVETALYQHRQGSLTCYDHPPTPDQPWWCCPCGEHQIRVSWRRHVAVQLVRDRVLPTAPVLVDLPEPKGNHCSGCGWSSGGHDPRCPVLPTGGSDD